MLRSSRYPLMAMAGIVVLYGTNCSPPAELPPPDPISVPDDISGSALPGNDSKALYDRVRRHNEKGEAQRAIALCVEFAEDLPDEPTCVNSRISYECGSAYLRRSLERSSEFHQQALDTAVRLGCPHEEASALHGLAQVAMRHGELHLAIRRFHRALEIYDALRASASAASALHGIGTLLIQLDELDAALDHLRQARDLRLETGDNLNSTLTQIGFALLLNGQNEEAIAHLEQALRGFRARARKRESAVALDHLGRVHRQLGATETALMYHREALQTFLEADDRRSIANTQANIALVQLDRDELRSAEEQLQAARDVLDDFPDLNTNGHIEGLLAQVARLRGDLDAARGHLEKALSVIEELRRKTPGRRLRASYFATWQDFYGLYIDVLMALERRDRGHDWAAKAFHAAERVRSRSLLDSLVAKPPSAVTGPDPELVREERSLRQAIANANLELLARTIDDPENPTRLDSDRTLPRLLLDYDLLRAEIDFDAGTSAGIKIEPAEAEALKLKDVQRLLDDDTLLLSYSLGTERSFLWLVGRHSLETVELARREEIENLSERAHNLLRTSQNPQASGMARRVCRQLSELILAPAGHLLNAKRLLIVSDGKLHYIPFAALPVPASATSDRATLLIQRHEIVQLPSASVLALLRRRRAQQGTGSRRLLLVGDPVLAPLSGLSRLASSRMEVQRIQAMVPADDVTALIAAAAGKDKVLQDLQKPTRIAHFATHGLLHDRHPELSTIVLSQFNRHGVAHDGLLYLYEVFRLRLSVDLVVLSACETASGHLVGGEGMVSMTHGFFAAGAARVIATLWRIEDQATAKLMEEFYRGLFDHQLPPVAALRAAQLAMLEEGSRWQAPYYWAGFIIQGDWL